MEWYVMLTLIVVPLLLLFLTGMPIAFAFMIINLIGVMTLWGGEAGIEQLILSMRMSVARWPLVPYPLFILMGEILLHSGLAVKIIDAVDHWIGRLPGRLGLLAVGAGSVFSTISGSSLSSVAMLGSVLTPEMERRGYKKPMSLGPILGSGGLAMMIPPSATGVLLASLAEISVGRLLMAIIVPGIIMAILFASYIIMRCAAQPSIAPLYAVTPPPMSERLTAFAKYILPTGLIIFLVIGIMFLGIATPAESSAAGALGCFLLVAAHRRLKWDVFKKAITGTMEITAMLLLIVCGATAFSQILAFSGATKGIINVALTLPVAPIFVIVMMQLVLLLLGTFMDVVAMMMITLPMFMPVIKALGFDPVWFGVIFLLNVEIALLTPPFGMCLFIMKGVAPKNTKMGDVYRASIPFIMLDSLTILMVMVFPAFALWLPNIMHIRG